MNLELWAQLAYNTFTIITQFQCIENTNVGNDVKQNTYGYKIHLIYGATASPSEKAYSTINDSPEAVTFSWELTTTPIEVEGFKPTATVVIDSTKVGAEFLKALEAKLYGSDELEPVLPTPNEIAAMAQQYN